MVDADFKGTRFAANTVGATQDVIIPGVEGTPVAAMFYMNTSTGLDLQVDEARHMFGFSDGTNNVFVGMRDQDGLGTTSTSRQSGAAACIRFMNVGATGSDGIATAAMIDGGVRLTWTNFPAAAYIVHVVAWFGDDVSAAVGTATPNTTGGADVSVTGLGFEPDHLITGATQITDLGDFPVAGGVVQQAHAVNLDPGVSQFSLAISGLNGVGTTNNLARITSDTLCQVTQGGGTSETVLVSMDVDGFTIQSQAGGTGPTITFIAINYGGLAFDLSFFQTPLVTGNVTHTVGFRPGSLLGTTTILDDGWDDVSTGNFSESAGFISYGSGIGTDIGTQFNGSVAIEDGVGTSNTKSRTMSSILSMVEGNGSALEYQADLIEMTATAYILDFTTVATPTSRTYLFFALEKDEFSGSGDKPMEPMECAGAGELVFSGSGDKELPGMQCAGAGIILFAIDGSGDATLPALQCAGTGRFADHMGTDGFQTLGSIQCAGAGEASFIFVGSSNLQTNEIPQIFRPIQCVGVGILLNPFVPVQTDTVLPRFDCAGSGVMTFIGSGGTTLPSLSCQGLAAHEYFNTTPVSSVFPAIQCAGQGVMSFVGSGDKELPAAVCDGVGESGSQGSGNKTIGAMACTGAGLMSFVGAGSPDLPSLQAEGSGGVQPEGASATALPALACAGQGALIFVGSGDSLLPAITKGQPQPSGLLTDFVGAGDKPLAIPAMAGAGLLSFIGAGDAELPAMDYAGTGALEFVGAGDAAIGPLACAGVGADKFIGSGDFELQALTCAGTDKPLAGGSTIIAQPDPDTPITGST